MATADWLRDRMTPTAMGYVAAVTVLASIGFASGQALLIGVAALVTLPASIVALPAFYLGAGLMGLVPGANPSHETSSGYGGPGGVVVLSETGGPASWYLVSLDLLGLLALALAALGNVLLIDAVVRWRRRVHAGA